MKVFGNDEKRKKIESLSKEYQNYQLLLREAHENLAEYDEQKIRYGKRLIAHVDNVIETLNEDDKFIIKKEVTEGQTGEWYLGYYSSSSYYRHRIKAYGNFLDCL